MIFHIAGIHKTLNVLKAIGSNKVKLGIFVHTTGIFSKYKIASEEYLHIEAEMKKIIESKDENMSYTILRPTMIYGHLYDQNMCKFIKMVDYLRIFPVINQGESKIQPVNVRDLGVSYYQLLMTQKDKLKPGYIISGESPITMIEAFKTISDKLGKKTIFISVPLTIAVFLAKVLFIISFKRIDYIEKVQRMGEDRNFSHADATNDFNYSPMSFDKGIEIEVEQYKKMKRGR